MNKLHQKILHNQTEMIEYKKVALASAIPAAGIVCMFLSFCKPMNINNQAKSRHKTLSSFVTAPSFYILLLSMKCIQIHFLDLRNKGVSWVCTSTLIVKGQV